MRYAFTRSLVFLFISLSIFSQNKGMDSIFEKESGKDSYSAKKEIYNTANYLPTENIKLIFDSDFGETTCRFEYIDEGYIEINESDDFHYIQNIEKHDEGYFLVSASQHVDVFLFISKNMETSYPTPALQLPEKISIGDKWVWEGYKVEDDDSIHVQSFGSLVSNDSLKLAAGNFEALHIKYEISTSEGEKSTINQWIAPNLGRIKIQIDIDGGGFIGSIISLLGYDELGFTLKEIKHLELAEKN